MEHNRDCDLEKVLDVVLEFNKETNYDDLLDTVLSEMMKFTCSDGGRLFTVQDDELHLRVIKNSALDDSLPLEDTFGWAPIAIDSDNIEDACVYAIVNDEVVVIGDVNKERRFDVFCPKMHDMDTGHTANSLVVFPLTAPGSSDHGKTGVVQLFSAAAMDADATARHLELCSSSQAEFLSKMAAIAMITLKRSHESEIAIREMHMVTDIHLVAVAEEKNRAKSRFLAKMSHEIRTPLNSILGITEIQLRQMRRHSKTTVEAFRRIYNSTTLLLELINNLLDLSKAESDKIEVSARPYALGHLISDVVQLNTVHTINKQLAFKLEVDSNLPATLVGDSLRLKQILNNILSNAFKYTDEGAVELSISCKPVLALQEGVGSTCLFISVKDTGKGMSKTQLKRLFTEEYVRFDEDDYTQGTGLGMAITHKLISAMGGSIEVRSKPKEGTCFELQIPQEIEGEKIIGEAFARKLEKFEELTLDTKKMPWFIYEPMPYGRVLIVDDQESNLYVAKGLCLPYQLNVETAESGQEVIDKIADGTVYDVIFMDHMMPGMDGIETTKKLRKMGYGHPIVALTANAVIGMEEVFLKNGFSDFISKPVDTRLLDSCLNRFVRDKQPQEVIDAAYDGYEPNQYVGKRDDVPIKHFLRDADKCLTAVDAFMKTQSFEPDALKSYILGVHSMKNLLRSIDKERLANDAGALEKAARNGEIEAIKSKTPSLLTSFHNIVNTLKSSAAEEDDEQDDEGVEDLGFLKVQLKEIQKACGNYNKMAAEGAMGALQERPCSKQTKQFLSDLSLYLLRGDYEEAAELAKQTGLLL